MWYRIPYEHKVKIRSNSIFYWSRTEVNFKPIESGTVVTVIFTGTVIVYLIYGTFVLFFLGLMGYFLGKTPTDLSPVIATLVFSLPIGIIPFLMRKIQNNIIGKLEYS